MNRIIQATIRSQFKPVAVSRRASVNEEQLLQAAFAARMTQMYASYGKSTLPSQDAQGMLVFNPDMLRMAAV